MSKELEALNYLVSLAVVGNKENHRGKIFESEEIILQVLKRNEPMKVDLETIISISYADFYDCPKCGITIRDVIKIKNYNYCPYCKNYWTMQNNSYLFID